MLQMPCPTSDIGQLQRCTLQAYELFLAVKLSLKQNASGPSVTSIWDRELWTLLLSNINHCHLQELSPRQ